MNAYVGRLLASLDFISARVGRKSGSGDAWVLRHLVEGVSVQSSARPGHMFCHCVSDALKVRLSQHAGSRSCSLASGTAQIPTRKPRIQKMSVRVSFGLPIWISHGRLF